MDESKSPLLDEFAKTFGVNIVFSTNGYEMILPSLDMIQEIYRIANKIIFDSKLQTREFKISRMTEKLKFASYVFAKSKINGKPVFINKIIYTKDGKTFYPPWFEVSMLLLHFKMPFNYLASIVVHEMIHQYTVEIGNELQTEEDFKANGKKYDPHENEFEKMMNTINDNYGLLIEVACDINNIKSEFEKAVQHAKKMLESESRNIIYNSDSMIVEKPSAEEIYLVHIF